MRFFSLLLIVFVVGATALGSPLATHAATPAHSYERLFYYREGLLARKSLFAHGTSIDILAPQTYTLRRDGTLSGSLEADVLAFAKKNKIKVLPLITNEKFSRVAYKPILTDLELQARAISALVLEARDRGYIGWQIDFEQMDAEDKDLFSAFVARAAKEFHTHNLKLSVAVIAKVSDNPADYERNLWPRLIGVYDYDALGRSADFVTIMSYDSPESDGPIAPLPWLNRVLTYSLAHIPKEKLSLGIPLYYWQWDLNRGKIVGIGGHEGITNVFKKYKVSTYYDPTFAAASLYYVKNGTPYTIWYENERSVREKLALIKSSKLHSASFWVLGLELPSVWKAVKQTASVASR